MNYKSATACAVALGRFHDSRFQGVRLVCRLRKGFTVPGSGSTVPTSRRPEEAVDFAPNEEPSPAPAIKLRSPLEGDSRPLDRYFVVKSLTVEDLEFSKQSGIWATQSHNEISLNQAFEVSFLQVAAGQINKDNEPNNEPVSTSQRSMSI